MISIYFQHDICYNFRITMFVFGMWQYKEVRIKRHYKARVRLTEPFKTLMSRIWQSLFNVSSLIIFK